METPNYRKASIYFDDETVLEVTQRGGGGSGVGGETGLEAVNLITGESTNAALAEKDETIAEKDEEIEGLEEQIAGMHPLIVRPNPLPSVKITNDTSSYLLVYPVSIRDNTGALYHDTTTVNPSSNKTITYTEPFIYGTENNWCVELIILSSVPVTVTYGPYGHGFTSVDKYNIQGGVFTGAVFKMYTDNADNLTANTLNISVSARS